MSDDKPLIQTHNLSKRFADGTLALDALNVTVEAGTIYCLLGGSGAGKTTALRLILGLTRPTAGRVEIRGQDLQASRQADTSLVYLPAQFPFYPRLSALENLGLFSGLASPKASREDLEQALRQVGIAERLFHHRVAGLSPGQHQRLALAIAVARDAAVWILDEPLSGLDPESASDFTEQLLSAKQRGKAILWATQDLFRARRLADRVGILDAGRQVLTYGREELEYQDLEQLYRGFSRGSRA